MFELIDDILEISRIEADQSSVVKTNFDLHRFLEDLMMMVLRPERKNLDVVLERDSGLPQYIRTDERRLRQILLNLLGNAVKFTENGRVTLRAKMTGASQGEGGAEGSSIARLEFEIEDTGIGIAEEDREKIFEPFVQLSAREYERGARDWDCRSAANLQACSGGTLRFPAGSAGEAPSGWRCAWKPLRSPMSPSGRFRAR